MMIGAIAGLLGGGKNFLLIGGIAIIGVMAGIGFLYYNHSQEVIKTLHENNAKLSIITETQTKTISALEKSMIIYQEETKLLNSRFNEIKKEVDKIEKTFSKHDLNKIGTKKAALLEKIINKATKKVLKEFESITKIKTFDE